MSGVLRQDRGHEYILLFSDIFPESQEDPWVGLCSNKIYLFIHKDISLPSSLT